MKTILSAIINGLRDGYAQPEGLSSGITYNDDPESLASRVYDRCANLGQRCGRFTAHL